MPDPVKVAIRQTIREVRSQTSPSYRFTSSHQICNQICTLEEYKRAQNIALYCAINGEIELDFLWRKILLAEKSCYFPVLNDNLTLSFLPATAATSFKNNPYGIPEPKVSIGLAINIEALDLMILPLVAFDMHCTRLGMGSGYYDRTLEKKKPKHLFGVAFQFQQVDFIVPRPWDVPLDAVITQKAIYWRPL